MVATAIFNIKIGKEKAPSRYCAKCLIFLVGRVRIELATNGLKGVLIHHFYSYYTRQCSPITVIFVTPYLYYVTFGPFLTFYPVLLN